MTPLWARSCTRGEGSSVNPSSGRATWQTTGGGDPTSTESSLSVAMTTATATLREVGLGDHRERRGTRPTGISGMMRAAMTAATSNPTKIGPRRRTLIRTNFLPED